MKAKQLNVFAPFTRVDDEARTVEGYCFVNEQVDGDAFRLTRQAMEDATADYLKWGAVREMHGSNAAGTANDGDPALGVFWDDKGALLRVRVSDDQAWQKVVSGTYKGLSVGVRPKVVRGKDVHECVWVENSLVDRPSDPDAKISLWRADGVPDADEETEVEEAVVRGAFAECVENREGSAMREAALGWLWDCLWNIQNGQGEDMPTQVREVCDEFRDYMVGVVERQALVQDEPSNPAIEKADAPVIERDSEVTLERAATLERDLTAALSRAESAEAELTRLQNTPAPTNRPAARFAPVERTFQANTNATPNADAATALMEEYEGLRTTLPGENDQDKRTAGVVRMNVIRQELAALGTRL